MAFQGQRDPLGPGFGPPRGDDGGVAGGGVSEFGQVVQAERVEPGREPGPVGGGVLDAQPAGMIKTRQHGAEVAAGDVLEQFPVADRLPAEAGGDPAPDGEGDWSGHLEGAQPGLAVAAAQVQLVEVVVQDRTEALLAAPGVGHRHPLGQGVGQRVGMPQALALHDFYRLAVRPGCVPDADHAPGAGLPSWRVAGGGVSSRAMEAFSSTV